MTFLEFIRKNLIIAVIVIVGILVGLIMMDYGDQGSAFSRDYRVEVNGNRYKAQDIMEMGYKTERYLSQINQLSAPVFDNFLMQMCDQNADGQLDERESVLYRLQRIASMPFNPNLKGAHLLNSWGNFGVFQDEENLAVNRIILQEAAKELGIVPSSEQIDAYIKAMPAFNNNGQFNSEAYKNIVGYRNGQTDNAGERDFREPVADIIIWDTLYSIITADMEGNTTAEKKIDQAINQNISGYCATFPMSAAPTPEAPTADAVKAYWEQTKENYKSEEKRAFTVVQIIAGEGMNGNDLNNRAAEIQEALSTATNADVEGVITNNIANADSSAGTIDYKLIACEECTADTCPEILNTLIKAGSMEAPLSKLAFSKDLTATGAGRISQHYLDAEGRNAYIIRAEGITPATPLPYEQAEAAARAALEEGLKVDLFYKTADELHKSISEALIAGKDMKTAFEAATTAGAEVTEFSDSPISEIAGKQEPGMELSEAGANQQRLHESSLRRTAINTLAPLVKSGQQAVITGITKRTTTEANDATNHNLRVMQLRDELMKEWLRAAYGRYKVFAPKAE